MNTIEYIKGQIKKLYESNPNIHLSVKLMQSKILAENVPVKIVDVYRNIFQIEEIGVTVRPERRSFQYGDVLIGRIVIQELDYTPPEPQNPKLIKG